MESVFTQKEPNTIQRLFARIAHRYDLANSLLSFGCDSLWRANVGARVKRWAPTTILDLATGSGVLAHELKKQIPGARVVGADFCAPMLTFARRARNRRVGRSGWFGSAISGRPIRRRDHGIRFAEYGFLRCRTPRSGKSTADRAAIW